MEDARRSSRKTFQARLDNMIETIRSDIRSGVYREGDYLPSEKTYAKQYRLSNKSVRQGLETLVAERMIEKIPRVGNKVARYGQGDEIVLKFGYHRSLLQEAVMQTLITEFHKAHPGIRVELVELSNNLNSYNFVKKMFEDDMLDVCTINYNGFSDFEHNRGFDLLETLEPNSHIYPFLTEMMMSEGKLKVQPFIFSPVILCYNKDHFREKGVLEPDSSWRWNVLFEQSANLALQNERLGFYFHFPSANRWPVFLLQSGIHFECDETGHFAANGAQLAESLRVCRELIYMQNRFPLFLSERDADTEELFFHEKVSMIMTTYFALNHHERHADFDYDIAPLPYLHDPRTLLLSIGLAIHANSKAKDSAKLFIDFLVSYRSQLTIRQKTLSIPSLKTAAEWVGKESIYRPSRFHMYRDIIPTFRSVQALNLTFDELALFYREAKLYWSGLETEEAVAERLVQLLCKRNEPDGGVVPT